jgi:phosphoglycerol transferase MdoB-like AlkP superfamily enzyme
MGNLPEETTWYLARWEGSWRTVSLVLLFGHFAIPFVGLIFQNVKRRPTLMAVAAIWLLVMHWVDLYWLVYPTFSPSGAVLGWIELMPMVGLGGLFGFVFWRSLSAEPLVPVGDPWLGDSIRFENR